jgi:hypothetical protein
MQGPTFFLKIEKEECVFVKGTCYNKPIFLTNLATIGLKLFKLREGQDCNHVLQYLERQLAQGRLPTYLILISVNYLFIDMILFLPFWHLLDDLNLNFYFFHFGNKKKIKKKFKQLRWGKKMLSNFALLKHTTPPSSKSGSE